MADTGREKVYQAEFRLRTLYDNIALTGNPQVELEGIQLVMPPEAKFASIESIQAYCDRVLADEPVPPVRARQRKGNLFAHYQNGEVAIPDYGRRWAMREIVVLHELAHHLARGAGHGPRFVLTFTELLGRVMGPQTELAYRIFRTHEGVLAHA